MNILLNDCSVLLNLLASDYLSSIAEATGWQFAICPAVRNEAKRLRDSETGEMIEVEITPLVASGLLQVLEISGEDEETLYVEQAATVDDGEAMSIAIAASRRLELAIDDKRATNHTRRTFPELRLWTTPEILKRWWDTGSVQTEVLSRVICRIESMARYFPPRSHPLSDWWEKAKNK
jgi:predicted nucleic acid-binding protein